MKEELQRDVFDALKQLAEKLGTTTEKLFEVYLRQAKVSAVTDFIITVLLIANAVFSVYANMRWSGASWYYYRFENIGTTSLAGGGLILVSYSVLSILGAGIMLVCSIQSCMTGIFNPAYSASKEIMNDIAAIK
jgi:hypothetical protein